jgi:60s Acidic ribosomal protein
MNIGSAGSAAPAAGGASAAAGGAAEEAAVEEKEEEKEESDDDMGFGKYLRTLFNSISQLSINGRPFSSFKVSSIKQSNHPNIPAYNSGHNKNSNEAAYEDFCWRTYKKITVQ